MRMTRVLGVTFADISYEEALARIHEMLRAGPAKHVVLANAHTLNLAWEFPIYRRRLEDAALVLRDGIGIKLATIWGRRPLGYNFVGTDFIPRLLGELPRGTAIFLFGARPGVAEAAADRLMKLHPHIQVAGCAHGYISGAEQQTLVLRLNAVRPDLLLVALGNPAQELWIADRLKTLDVKVAIGVGALFDYLAGTVPRAPRWLCRTGGEWIYRLTIEPRRLWRRYLIGNVKFLWRVGLDRPTGTLQGSR